MNALPPPRVPRILVVDDDEDARDAMRDLLQSAGFEVGTAAGFREGLSMIRSQGWDAVLADQRLNDGEGVALLVEASRRSPGIPRALMSAFDDLGPVVRALNAASISHYFEKPIAPEALLLWLQHVLPVPDAGPPVGLGRIPPQALRGHP